MTVRYWLAIMPEENFKFTIARQIFAYPSRTGERARSQIEPGDRIVVFVTKQGCVEYCGSFAAVLEVAGPWRKSQGPTWPDEVREGKVKYDPVVDVKVVAKGKVEVGEVAGELSRILGREVKGGAELRTLEARQLPEAAGRLIEEKMKVLARPAKAEEAGEKARASHEDLRAKVMEVGEALGLRAEAEYTLDDYRYDVVFFRPGERLPWAAVEIHVGGDLYKDLASLKHAWDHHRSIPIYVVGSEDDARKVEGKIQSDFREIKDKIILLRAGELEDLHRALRSEAVRRVVKALLLGP